MKKSNLVIIGTLAAGLLLAGCDHGPGPGPLTGQSNPEGAKALKAALGQPDDVIAFDEASATLTVLQDLTIGTTQPVPSVQSLSQAAFDYQSAALFAAAYAPVQNLEIPYGVTFKVAAAVKVTVSEGATVTVAAGNESYKPAEITFAPKGDADAGGSVTVESGGVIDARGAITVPEDAKLEAKGTVKMTASAVLEAAGTVEVPSGGKLEGTGAVKVAGTGALTAAGEVKVAALTTAGTVTVPEGGKLEATGTVKVESTATLEVKGTVTAAEVTVQGTVTVAEDAALETTLGTVTVENGGSLDAKGEVTVPEGEKIAAENGAKISGVDEDKIDVQDGAAVEKKYSASSVDSLAAAIASAKAAATGSVTGVVQLTEAFYTDANSKNAALVIDAGETDNATHYIVRGLGIGSGKPALSAAILLANDNVTLEDVKIQVTLDNNAVQSAWTTATNYRSSLFIGRASSGTTLLTEANAASNNVTVRNCDITATGLSNFTAGIYVWGGSGDDAIFPSQNISITDNTIRATGYNGNAVQGINIRVWHPLIKITGNAITARYGTKGDPKYSGKPASAIFMNRVYGAALTGSNADPVISGNTLTSDVYSFYINACETITVEADDHKGVGALRSDNFAVAETTWALSTATDKDSTYKKLFNALVANTGSNGFGSVSVPYSTNAFEFEHYEINNGVIVAISVLGDHISNGAYSGGSETNKFGTTTNGVDYGRKLASAPTDYSNSQNHFCFGPNAAGTGYQYATSYVYSDNN